MTIDHTIRWFVMTHYDMRRFLQWLNTENTQRLSDGKAIIEPFYPYDFLQLPSEPLPDDKDPGRRSSKSRKKEATVKDDFINYVFLKATENDIDSLVNDKRYIGSRIRLRYYMDTDGSHATVPDKMMQEFLQACVKYRGLFEITPPLRSIETTDKVRIKSGPFTGQEASVVRVTHSHGAIHLELAIELVSGVMNICMHDVDSGKVEILNRDSTDAIRTDFIEYTQNHLLLILKHRVKRTNTDAMNRHDTDMLTRLYRYRYHEIKNDAARHHFMALMLICAHLCHYKDDEAELREKIQAILTELNQRSESKAATDTRTYLWIALYISTHDPSYRDAAKQYVRDHQPKSAKLRSFVSLIRTGRKV
jgi:transcription antitermination factor NusG